MMSALSCKLKTTGIGRGIQHALGALALLFCAACDQGDGKPASFDQFATGAVPADMALGRDDAPVTMIVYANWACPACLQFHEDVLQVIKTGYIETGKVKLIFRAFPTPPVELSVAGFAIARCTGPDRYHTVLDALFSAQERLLNIVRANGNIDAAMRTFAADHGLKGQAYDACIGNRDIIYAISEAAMQANALNIQSVPAVFLNDKRLTGYDWRRAEGMKTHLDKALNNAGVE